MKLVATPIPLFLTFCLVAAVIRFFSSAAFWYLVFNFLILVVILWSDKPSKDEIDGLWPPLLSSWEDAEDACVKIKGENAESSCEVAGDTYVDRKAENHNNEKPQDNDDEKHSCSDGSADDIGWQDVDEEFDENLENRIEDFIAKVNKGWREEMLRDLK